MKRMQSGLVAVVVAFVLAAAASLVAQAGRRDGNWEVTMEMQMPNMPGMPNMPAGMSMPAMKMTQCVTKEEAADPEKALPHQPPQRGGGPPPDCKVADYKTDGNKVTWTMKCTGAQTAEMVGEMVYGTDSYAGTMKMTMMQGGQPMSMTTKYSGKRLGDCVKK